MKRQVWLTVVTAFLLIFSLLSLSLSCSQTASTAELAQGKTQTSTQVSAGDYKALSDRLSDLEKRVKRLEQGLDGRVIEYNVEKSPVPQSPGQAAATETHKVQTAVLAAMADVSAGNITGGAFGNTGHASPPTGTNLTISGPKSNTTVGAFIVGGAVSVRGDYTVATDGSITRNWYPQ